jgi:hypothetical protein
VTLTDDEKAEDEQWLYINELERDYYAQRKKLTDKELLTLFPEAKIVLPDKIREWENKKLVLLEEIRSRLKSLKECAQNDFELWLGKKWLELNEGQKLLNAERHIIRLKRLLWISSGKIVEGRLTDEQIRIANQAPLADLYGQRLRRNGKTLVGLCPFHQEKHASFTIYITTNTYKCYGCGEQGDTIKFLMALHGYSFKEAVRYLTGE